MPKSGFSLIAVLLALCLLLTISFYAYYFMRDCAYLAKLNENKLKDFLVMENYLENQPPLTNHSFAGGRGWVEVMALDNNFWEMHLTIMSLDKKTKQGLSTWVFKP